MIHSFLFRLLAFPVVAAALCFGGCASSYKVTVHASARASAVHAGGASFCIRHQGGPGGVNALRQKEVADHVKTALSAKGLFETPDADSADMLVDISYGIESPRVEHTLDQELVFGRPVSPSERIGVPPESAVARAMMGYAPVMSTRVMREKHLSICARTNRGDDAERPPEDLWRVEVAVDDESDDLRGHLAVLISAAMDYIGRNTVGDTVLTMRSDDEAIRFVRKGL